MQVVADTNIFLAVGLNEPERAGIVELTMGYDLVAPDVLPFEMGTALAALVKKGRLQADEATATWDSIQAIAVELCAIDIRAALGIALKFKIYAYDAYVLECALSRRLPLLTLDGGMKHIARDLSIQILE